VFVGGGGLVAVAGGRVFVGGGDVGAGVLLGGTAVFVGRGVFVAGRGVSVGSAVFVALGASVASSWVGSIASAGNPSSPPSAVGSPPLVSTSLMAKMPQQQRIGNTTTSPNMIFARRLNWRNRSISPPRKFVYKYLDSFLFRHYTFSTLDTFRRFPP
jgi:hypothetical protein